MLNIPNALTLLRALGVPLFLYLFLVADKPVASFVVIALGGVTDYLDGKVARYLNQTSEFGAKFDPAVDRLYIAAVIIALASKDYLPWVLVISILVRDFILFLIIIYQKLKGIPFLAVTFLCKAATFNLHLMPVFSSFMAIFLLNEKFMNFHIFGAITIVLGIYLSSKKISLS